MRWLIAALCGALISFYIRFWWVMRRELRRARGAAWRASRGQAALAAKAELLEFPKNPVAAYFRTEVHNRSTGTQEARHAGPCLDRGHHRIFRAGDRLRKVL
jgi:hypothetical protein